MVEHGRGIAGRVQFAKSGDPPKQRDRVMAVRGETQQIGAQGVPGRALGEPQDEVVGSLVEPLADLSPEDLFGGHAERVRVPRRGRREELRRVVLLAELGAGRHGRVVVGERPLQPLDSSEQVDRVGVCERVRVAVADDLEVEVVRPPSAGEHRVQLLPGLLAGRQSVHAVGGEPLGTVDRGGVAELDAPADVVGGQLHGVLRPPALDAHAAIREYARHAPPVAVLHPVTAADRQLAGVDAGDHQVAGDCDAAVGQLGAATEHGAAFEVAPLREPVQLGDEVPGRGEH
ncbi:hypothetical protein [Micropruina glycogenica]|uniref:hypothetical protein n=1 Tax=Micropruina glycogenica TaxID=75385 RepID=UPI0026B352D9